jgi:ADP-ribosyl-[dinitrogen reductase] hydrolase
MSRQSSQITHADPRCTYGSAILNLTIVGLLEDADEPLQDTLDYAGSDAPDELVKALRPLARGDSPAVLETSGYVLHSLQTALHDGLFAESA